MTTKEAIEIAKEMQSVILELWCGGNDYESNKKVSALTSLIEIAERVDEERMTTKEAIEIAKEIRDEWISNEEKGNKLKRDALTHLIQIAERVDEEKIGEKLFGKLNRDDAKFYSHAIVSYLQGEK